jgi:hypothetical protein
VAVDIKFVFDVSGEMAKAGKVRVSNPASDSLMTVPVQAELLDYIRTRMSLVLGVTILCLASMIYLYVQKIPTAKASGESHQRNVKWESQRPDPAQWP